MWTVSNTKSAKGQHVVYEPVCEHSVLIVYMNITDELDIFLVTFICTKRDVGRVVHILNGCMYVDWVWNLMAHAQKPDFVFCRNGQDHLNRRGHQLSTVGSQGVRISGSNAGYTTFRGSVKSTGYPLHSPVSPSLPLPCVTVCHQVSNALYLCMYIHLSMGEGASEINHNT